MDEFNPNSLDAVLGRIIQKLEDQENKFDAKCNEDRRSFQSMLEKQDKTNGRLNTLEGKEENYRGRIWGFSIGIPIVVSLLGWVLTHSEVVANIVK